MDRKLLHVRQIRVEIFEDGPNQIAVVGHLEDTRPNDLRSPDGSLKRACTFHDLALELVVGLPDFIIKAVRVRMDTVPEEGCCELIPDFQALIGLRIESGFTRQFQQLLGGLRTCSHLVALASAVAAPAVKGGGAYLFEHSPSDRARMVDEYLVASCRVPSAGNDRDEENRPLAGTRRD